MNVDLWILAVENVQFPPPNTTGHVNARLEKLIPTAVDEIDALFDLGKNMDDEERGERIRALFEDHVVPWFVRASTLAGLRNIAEKGDLKRVGIFVDARPRLGLGPP